MEKKRRARLTGKSSPDLKFGVLLHLYCQI